MPRGNDRPVDIFIPNFIIGHNTAMDVTVASPLCLQNFLLEACEPGAYLRVCHMEKFRRYQRPLRQGGILLAPTVVSTFGLGG